MTIVISEKTRHRILDALYLSLMILPFLACILLKILFNPASSEIAIEGALVYFTIPMPLQDFPISEAQINSAAVVLFVLGFCLYLTNGIKAVPDSRRQHLAEFIVEAAQNFVNGNMGEKFAGFAPFVAGIMAISVLSSLSTLLGIFPPTSDFNIVAGWAICVFILITYYKLKGGLGVYVKGFFEPLALFAPLNVISEVATPVSMTFRHFGNVLSGSVISVLIASALQGLSHILLGWLPGFLGNIPLLQIGIPAVLSLYFDIFSSLMQAFIFAILTILYIANGYSEEDYQKRLQRRAERDRKRAERRAAKNA